MKLFKVKILLINNKSKIKNQGRKQTRMNDLFNFTLIFKSRMITDYSIKFK